MARIGYLVHDVGDAAVHRRIRMMRAGGAEVALAGFSRGNGPPASVDGAPPLVLGRTHDARLARRIPQVAAAALLGSGRLARHFGRLDAIVARNLEMLPIAARVAGGNRQRPRLIYECLDIHRLLTEPGALRATIGEVERRLARSVDLVITSSPGFIDGYFREAPFCCPILVVENKVFGVGQVRAEPTPPGPPWRIGWFGALRCRRSLDALSGLAAGFGGDVEVIIRGNASPAVFPDFQEAVARAPHVHFKGPYRNPADLAAIYGEVHFNWCIDYYEEGRNSAWLLPNRVYEGGLNNTVPIALSSVETGRFLDRNALGIRIGDTQDLAPLFKQMTAERYDHELLRLGRAPERAWAADQADCENLISAILGETARLRGNAA